MPKSKRKNSKSKTSRTRVTKVNKSYSSSIFSNPFNFSKNKKVYAALIIAVAIFSAFFVYRSNAAEFVAVASAGQSENCTSNTGTVGNESSSTSSKRSFGTCTINSGQEMNPVLYYYGRSNKGTHTTIINQMKSKGFNTAKTCVNIKSTSGTATVEFSGIGKSNTITINPTTSDYQEFCTVQSIDGTNNNAKVKVTSGSVILATFTVEGQVITTEPSGDTRPVVKATDTTIINQPSTIYDFEGRTAGEVEILASNVEVRNLKGGGARRIGDRSKNVTITDSGFRNFEFTFINLRSDGGDIVRPYFINGKDVNSQPNTGDGDIIQLWSTAGEDIIEPLLDNITAYGKQRPSGSKAHNDTVQYTAIGGGKVVSPTIRNSTLEGASSASVQIKHVSGTFTFENNTLSERYGSFHAVIGSDDAGLKPKLNWKNNTMKNDASAVFQYGWSYATGSEQNIPGISVN